MDGTLVDTEPYWFEVERQLVEGFGGEWPEHHAKAVVGFDLLDSAAYIQEHGGVPLDELNEALERRSGLKGLSGTSGDLRDVLAGRADGDEDCALAFDVFVHQLCREIAAMTAAIGGLDVLVMTGGIGEHSPLVRAQVAERLDA